MRKICQLATRLLDNSALIRNMIVIFISWIFSTTSYAMEHTILRRMDFLCQRKWEWTIDKYWSFGLNVNTHFSRAHNMFIAAHMTTARRTSDDELKSIVLHWEDEPKELRQSVSYSSRQWRICYQMRAPYISEFYCWKPSLHTTKFFCCPLFALLQFMFAVVHNNHIIVRMAHMYVQKRTKTTRRTKRNFHSRHSYFVRFWRWFKTRKRW